MTALEWCHIHIPKTGGSSVEAALRNGVDDLKMAHHMRGAWDWKGRAHCVHKRIWEHLDSEEARDWWARAFLFTTVRHPVDRLISAFHTGTKKAGPAKTTDWDEFMERLGEAYRGEHRFEWGAGSPWNLYYPQRLGCPLDELDYVLRFETLAADFRVLAARIKTDRPLVLGHERRSTLRAREPDITDAQWELIEEIYEPDLSYLGYDLKVYRPEEIRK
jgi:hypothetical protein